MTTPDYSRQDLQLFTAAALIVGVIVGISFSQFLGNTNAGAAWSGVFGALVGGVLTFAATRWHNNEQRKGELAALKASIYAEIADRVARCVNDYIKPWRDLKVKDPNTLQLKEIEKFSPTDPVVFPAVASKLGVLEPKVMFAVTQFYFRLAALSQAIEYVYNVRPTEVPWEKKNDEAHVKLIVTRLRSCFGPALEAIEKLDVKDWAEFDENAKRVYQWLQKSPDNLREALRKNMS
jgi:hypothetical protein